MLAHDNRGVRRAVLHRTRKPHMVRTHAVLKTAWTTRVYVCMEWSSKAGMPTFRGVMAVDMQKCIFIYVVHYNEANCIDMQPYNQTLQVSMWT